MTILLLLIPLGLGLLALAIWAFAWAVRHGQFEDLEAEGARILFEDPVVPDAGERAAASRAPAPRGDSS